MAHQTLKIMVLNGPNLNLLGQREPHIYGTDTLEDINASLSAYAAASKASIDPRQSNHEGALVEAIHAARTGFDGLIINAGAYTHTSIAIRDALSALSCPIIEVHLSNIHAREAFRQTNYLAPVCTGSIIGMGARGYRLALRAMIDMLRAD